MAPQDLPRFPFTRENGADPPALNADLRHNHPISKALDSQCLSADRRTTGYPEIHPGGHKAKEATPTFVNIDDPDHAKQRGMLEELFKPETVEKRWRPMMESTINTILDKFIQKGSTQQPIDLMEEFAVPIPTQIIYKALGVPDSDVESLSKDSEVRNSTSRNAAESANDSLQEYMRGLVEKKIDQPADNIISKLVMEQYKLGNISKEFVTILAFLVLTASNAALINNIGLGVLTLLQHPEQLQKFMQNPSLAGQVVNEITRYHTASTLNSRRAVKADTELGGVHFKKGDGVICSIQAANRDEEKFPNAEKFDINRKMSNQDSLGFGHGPHRCQAESFSRVELEIVFTKLFHRLPNLRLAKMPDEMLYTEPTTNVGVTELLVYFK